jgi:DNA-binding XRE family transcriptional regulator
MSTKDRIMKLLEEDSKRTQKDLAKDLGISEATISYHIEGLVKEGRLKAERTSCRVFEVVSKLPSKFESKLLSKSRMVSDKPSQAQADASKRMYLHRMERTYPSSSMPDTSQTRLLKLNNNEQHLGVFEGVSYRTTTKHIIIEGMQLYGPLSTPAPELQHLAELRCDAMIKCMERRGIAKTQHGLNDELLGSTSIVEIAITEHEAAKELMQHNKGKITLYADPATGKWVCTDHTPNPAAIESNSADLIKPWQDFTKDLEEHDAWNVLKQAIPQLATTVLEIKNELKVHQSAYRALEHMAKKLDKILSQRRL